MRLRVGQQAPLRLAADMNRAVIANRDDRRHQRVAARVADHDRHAVLHVGDQRVGRPEIDPDNFAHTAHWLRHDAAGSVVPVSLRLRSMREQVRDVVALEEAVAQRFENRAPVAVSVHRASQRAASSCSCASCCDALRLDRLPRPLEARAATPRPARRRRARSRISSSSSLSANTSSSSAGGTCSRRLGRAVRRQPFELQQVLDAADRLLQRPIRVVQVRRPLEARASLSRRRVVEVVRMKLPAQRPEPLLRDRPTRRSASAAGRGS